MGQVLGHLCACKDLGAGLLRTLGTLRAKLIRSYTRSCYM